MIRLHKEVRRITGAAFRGRDIIVAMRPPSLLTFRLKGTRKEYPLAVVSAFDLAVKIEARKLYAEKLEARKAKREARRRGL